SRRVEKKKKKRGRISGTFSFTSYQARAAKDPLLRSAKVEGSLVRGGACTDTNVQSIRSVRANMVDHTQINGASKSLRAGSSRPPQRVRAVSSCWAPPALL